MYIVFYTILLIAHYVSFFATCTRNLLSLFCFRSPLNVEDDEDIDHMEIPHTPKRNSKRVYQPTLEVRERISRTLKVASRAPHPAAS
jgi:hypothetical protein